MSEPSILFFEVNERQGVFHRRAFLMGGLAGAGLLALGGRLAQLQLVEAQRYQKLSAGNQFNYRLVPPPRGLILDRNGVPLASNRPNFRLMITKDKGMDVEAALDDLSKLVPIDGSRRARLIKDILRQLATRGAAVFLSTHILEIAERIKVIAPHPLARLRFTNCRVPAGNMLGKPAQGFKIAMQTLDIFRTSVAAAALGFARRALDEALRRDLVAQLNVITLRIPALRERHSDVEPLAKHFIETFNREFGKKVRRISPEAMELLLAYQWPGNVRELRNVIERSVLLTEGELLDQQMLPLELRAANQARALVSHFA